MIQCFPSYLDLVWNSLIFVVYVDSVGFSVTFRSAKAVFCRNLRFVMFHCSTDFGALELDFHLHVAYSAWTSRSLTLSFSFQYHWASGLQAPVLSYSTPCTYVFPMIICHRSSNHMLFVISWTGVSCSTKLSFLPLILSILWVCSINCSHAFDVSRPNQSMRCTAKQYVPITFRA